MMLQLTRRAALLGLTSAYSLGRVSLALAGAATEQRFVVVILRGALDGLSAVVPHGDPALTELRAGLMPEGLLDLGGFYGLHPSLTNLHAMYQAGELLPVHAVAGPTRVRSHFEAQDCLESGADHRMTSGWLNRAVAAMPATSGTRPQGDAMAIGVSVPLLLRGPATVGNWAPHGLVTPVADLYTQIAALHQGDQITGPAITEGLRERGFTGAVLSNESGQLTPERYTIPAVARATGELLRATDGPRIVAAELGGWDTHAAQVPRLNRVLKDLDAGLAGLKEGLGQTWRQTAVLVMTEFGRTVRMNGTNGTDHGTATVAFVVGGAVAGGRVMADWPGLDPSRLLENRDLQPTRDLRAIAKGLLAQHLGLGTPALAAIFPDSAAVEPEGGLIRS
jgi:uncharacterized protein (DUF1501 family)